MTVFLASCMASASIKGESPWVAAGLQMGLMQPGSQLQQAACCKRSKNKPAPHKSAPGGQAAQLTQHHAAVLCIGRSRQLLGEGGGNALPREGAGQRRDGTGCTTAAHVAIHVGPCRAGWVLSATAVRLSAAARCASSIGMQKDRSLHRTYQRELPAAGSMDNL